MEKNILCYGDSNTWGAIPRWKDEGGHSKRYAPDVRWTGRMAAALGGGFHVVEEGLGGRTTMYDMPGLTYRNGLPYLLPCLMSHRPLDLIVLMLGVNDLQLPIQPDAAHLGDGIRTLLQVIRDTPACGRDNAPPPVLLLSPAPIRQALGRREVYPKFDGDKGRDLSLLFPQVYRQAADEFGCFFLNAALYAQPSEADGLHWEPDSHARLADAVTAEVRRILDR